MSFIEKYIQKKRDEIVYLETIIKYTNHSVRKKKLKERLERRKNFLKYWVGE